MTVSRPMLTLSDTTFAAEIEQYPGLALVDFTATWCKPCQIIAPHVDAIDADRAFDVKVAKLDIDENVRTVARYNVRSAPTLLFFRNGELVGRIIGAVPRARIEETLRDLTASSTTS
jgi:thioredoxin 1